MRTGRTPHPDPGLRGPKPHEPAKFQVSTDEQGRTSVVHVGPNRAQRQEQKAVRKKAFKNAIRKLQANARKAERAMARQGVPPATLDAVEIEPDEPPSEES